jgi:hypothetical protein
MTERNINSAEYDLVQALRVLDVAKSDYDHQLKMAALSRRKLDRMLKRAKNWEGFSASLVKGKNGVIHRSNLITFFAFLNLGLVIISMILGISL